MSVVRAALRSYINGKYVCADNYGNGPLIARANAINLWETFEINNLDGVNITLRALVNNKFVTCPNDGASPLIASATTVGRSETFQIVPNQNGQGFLALINNKFVCADNYGNGPLIAKVPHNLEWERFFIEVL